MHFIYQRKVRLIYIIPIFENYLAFMDLIIDIGNTRIKYAILVSGKVKEKRYCAEVELESLLGSLKEKVSRVMLSSVKELDKDVIERLEKNYPQLHILTSNLKMPFENSYETPQTIGADRLALTAGAMYMFPASDVLIVDIGTCMTFDFIDSSSVYHGGAISPGLQMRFKALNEFTGKLPLIELQEPKNLIGKSTEESIRSGVVNGMLKELDGIIDAYKLRYPEVKIILTGGDALFFDNKLKNSIFADQDILLKGMYFILEQHADKKI